MIWATDVVGMETLLFPSEETIAKFNAEMPEHDPNSPIPPLTQPGINWCPEHYWDAVAVEVHSTALIQAAGYQVDAMEAAFHTGPGFEKACWQNGNVLSDKHYFDINIQPYELIFIKANRDIDPTEIERYTDWTDQMGYSSYEHCKA